MKIVDKEETAEESYEWKTDRFLVPDPWLWTFRDDVVDVIHDSVEAGFDLVDSFVENRVGYLVWKRPVRQVA